jgi:hypothetical protein
VPIRSAPLDLEGQAPTNSNATIPDRKLRVAGSRGEDAPAAAAQAPISQFKVFSATKAADREHLGERVTEWIRANPQLEVRRTVVSQSSDNSFHCLSFVLMCAVRPAR